MKRMIFFIYSITFSLSVILSTEPIVFSALSESVDTIICTTILKEAYSRMGYDLTIKEYPSIRALQYSNDGDTDGELNRIAGIEKEYINLIMVPVPLSKVEAVVFSRKVDFEVKDWDSLKPYKVGIRRGIKFTEQGTASVEGLNPTIANSEEKLYHLLLSERVDVIVAPRISKTNMALIIGETDIKLLPPPLETFYLYHYLHKKNSKLLPEITSILKEMEDRGEIEEIRNEVLEELFPRIPTP